MTPTPTTLTLGSPYTNRLVLQRGRENIVWGWDIPHQSVSLSISGTNHAATTAEAGADGFWCLTCPELDVGGPYELTVRGSRKITLCDVLVGEVWLVSGQSNMEWPLSGALNSEVEVANAHYPEKIRLFTVQTQAADAPCTTLGGEWQACTPENAEGFSAVGYFFARAIHEQLGVPVGIINASWGGTPIEAWTSHEALQSLPGMQAALEKQRALENEAPQLRQFAVEKVLEWERTQLPNDPGNLGYPQGWAATDYDDTGWPSMRVPGSWQSRGLLHNGVVWFRKTVLLPPDWVDCDLVLNLGMLDDFDETYVNGVSVGSHPKGTPEAHRIRRCYAGKRSLVRDRKLSIAVRIFDHFGDGGFMGPGGCMRLVRADAAGEPIVLSGDWKYKVEHAIDLVPGTVFQTYPKLDVPLPQYRLAALYNAMIAPLVRFGIRGALWYQGESNVDRHKSYRAHMVALVRDWRGRFQLGQFPFYFVQLASYSGGSEWPYLREAQDQALSEPNTGMAVALDIGDPSDIHPRNKQEVGRRLASLALACCYERPNVECEGPRLKRVDIAGTLARVEFEFADGLTSGGKEVAGFELAGADGRYHAAKATIDGHQVLVTCENVQRPANVRYAWCDAPIVTLRNSAGFPAAPFRTDCS